MLLAHSAISVDCCSLSLIGELQQLRLLKSSLLPESSMHTKEGTNHINAIRLILSQTTSPLSNLQSYETILSNDASLLEWCGYIRRSCTFFILTHLRILIDITATS